MIRIGVASHELASAIAKLRPDVLVLGGEVAVLDEQLVSRFHLLGDPDTGVLCTPPNSPLSRRPLPQIEHGPYLRRAPRPSTISMWRSIRLARTSAAV